MNTLNLQLYDTIRKELNLSDEKARQVTVAFQETIRDEIKTDSEEYKSILKQDFKELEKNLENKIYQESARLEIKMEQISNNNLKWLFGMFLALALMIFGIYLKK